MLKQFLVCIVSPEGMDFNLTCTDILIENGKK